MKNIFGVILLEVVLLHDNSSLSHIANIFSSICFFYFEDFSFVIHDSMNQFLMICNIFDLSDSITQVIDLCLLVSE